MRNNNMNTDKINELVEAAEEWVTGNEFGAYNGSLRSLVAWFAKTERRFQWTSMTEVDEATRLLTEKLDRKPVKKESKSLNTDFGPTATCASCGKSLVGTKYDARLGSLCSSCNDLVHGYASELIDEDKFISKID